MNPVIDTQELARRFNEDEAVWRRYQPLRMLRRRISKRSRLAKQLDQLAWQRAERECRQTRCIGRMISLPQPRAALIGRITKQKDVSATFVW